MQEITRNKAALQAQKEDDQSFVPEPFILLDPTMVILHVDITFDDYNSSILNTRNLNYAANMGSSPNNQAYRNSAAAGSLNQPEQTYFYLSDNP